MCFLLLWVFVNATYLTSSPKPLFHGGWSCWIFLSLLHLILLALIIAFLLIIRGFLHFNHICLNSIFSASRIVLSPSVLVSLIPPFVQLNESISFLLPSRIVSASFRIHLLLALVHHFKFGQDAVQPSRTSFVVVYRFLYFFIVSLPYMFLSFRLVDVFFEFFTLPGF